MIDIYQLYIKFLSYVNTYVGGWYRPQSDFQLAVNDIVNDLWNSLTSQTEKSQEVRDNLIYFLKSKNIKVEKGKGNFGTFVPPVDYGRFASASFITDGTTCLSKVEGDNFESDEEKSDKYYDLLSEVEISNIDNMRWDAVMQHLTKRPTLQKPKLTQIDGGFKVAPRDVSVVKLDYYIKPRDAVFAYTKTAGDPQTGSGDQLVYNLNESLPIQFPTTMINELLIRLGERYGSYTRDQFLTQFSTQQKAAS